MTARGRALLLVLAVAAALVVGAAPVGAHNSRTAFTGTVGPYDVVASVRDVDDSGAREVELDLVVRTDQGHDPVEDATVRLVGSPDGAPEVGPVVAERYGNVYRSTLPGRDVEGWDVEVTIDGPDGRATTDQQVPGPAALHDGLGLGLSGPTPGPGWLIVVAAGLVALPLLGFTRWWREAALLAGGVLLATCATVVVGVWARSPEPWPARAVALVPALVLAALLVAGLVLTRRRRNDGQVLVFAGSAGLAVVLGLVNREVLTSADTGVLAPGVARATAALALGVGGGLALMALVVSRTVLRGLLTRPAGTASPSGTGSTEGSTASE